MVAIFLLHAGGQSGLRAVLSGGDQARDTRRPMRQRAGARRSTAVDRRYTPRYDYASQTLNENAYDKWREYDAEDAVRFYALRLHEFGFIKSNPQKILAEGSDWRFLNERVGSVKINDPSLIEPIAAQ